MRDPLILLKVLKERGQRKLPLERVYRHLFIPDWFLRAYGKIYRNHGAMTAGTTGETVDGMSSEKVHRIIELLKEERYRWTPVRRTYIPKAKGGQRPLGIPTWSDKVVQEVLRTLLEAYYEPQFSDLSHGFRPGRSCHTALHQIKQQWTGAIWFIEGDISKCFDRLDHCILLKLLGEKIDDGRLIRLIEGLLKAGYLEDWRWNETMSGAPQGGILSPLLSNIYLHELDRFVEETLIPAYTRGKWRKSNPEYRRILFQRKQASLREDKDAYRSLTQELRQQPTGDMYDPKYRRLRYVRYADDFLLGFIGPRREAEDVRESIRAFLQDQLHLELSLEKTLITHAKSEKARFLGYDLTASYCNTKVNRSKRRVVNGDIALLMPVDVLRRVRSRFCGQGKPYQRSDLRCDDDYTIISRYQSVLRGLYNFYQLAVNVSKRMCPIRWLLERSLVATLARKYQTTARKILRKYKTPHNGLRALEVKVERPGKDPLVARFGGFSMPRVQLVSDVSDCAVDRAWFVHANKRCELLRRLCVGKCELCGATEEIQVHHIRKLADLNRGRHAKPESSWVRIMIARKRKTLVVCQACHERIHAGQYDGRPLK